MGNINVLSFAVANLIAAGEVVDRPSSVIKELIENSIDSGADRIAVEIMRGGVSFMRVTDNGCGMSAEDLPIAVKRHATSKIKSADDLDGITTLGFRGEALAAISAVSDVRIISKTADSELGAMFEIHSGRDGELSERGASNGTTVIVENLFANVPARLKFLKKDSTEAMSVASVVEKEALAHPEIAFSYISDGTLKLETFGNGELRSVVRAIFGKEYCDGMIPVDDDRNGIRISGLICSPMQVRANRNYENFFINGRYVKTKTAMSAIEQAYRSYIPPEKFPGCVIKIEIAPSTVDVNVHPSKLEVKFSNERPVFDAVYYAVRGALTSNERRPELDFNTKNGMPAVSFAPGASNAYVPLSPSGARGREQLDILSTDSNTSVPTDNGAASGNSGGEWWSISPRTERETPPADTAQNNTAKKDIAVTIPQSNKTESEDVTMSRNYPNDHSAVEISKAEGDVDVSGAKSAEQIERTEGARASEIAEPTESQNSGVSSSKRECRGFDPEYVASTPYLNGTRAPENITEYAEYLKYRGDDYEVGIDDGVTGFEDYVSPGTGYVEPLIIQLLYGDEREKDHERSGDAASAVNCNEGDASQGLSNGCSDPSRFMDDKGRPIRGVSYRIVGELFNSYVLVEKGDTCLVVDKHAAHERQNFEMFKARMNSAAHASVLLAVPRNVSLLSAEIAALEEYRSEIESIGFEFVADLGGIAVVAIPDGVELDDAIAMLETFAGELLDGDANIELTKNAIFERALYQASCKASIKAGRVYSNECIERVISELERNPDITYCPHGRPVAFEIKKSMLDHRFKRS